MEWLASVESGFAKIDAAPEFKVKALENLKQWMTVPECGSYVPQLQWQIREGRYSDLLDQFYQVLPYGTGGRRGAVGIGPNRMNLWTLGSSVQGHCEYLKERFADSAQAIHVVLAYDVRQFEDKRKVYNKDLPNPVLHLTSRDFALHAARVYAANGIHAHILPQDSKRFMATPELSFAIRYLKAHGGLNISASHNPPDDNGGKFYDERGGQPVPPDDQIMSDLVEQVTQVRELSINEAVKAGRIHWLAEEVHRAYIDLCKRQSLSTPPNFDEFRLVYSPLHGVGSMTAMEALQAVGFRPIPVESQMAPDGQFPNVTKTPNPEVPECLDKAEAVAKEHEAHLVLATDPDADRIGGLASANVNGGAPYRFLTGNEICALATHYKLEKLKSLGEMPDSPVVICTEVTTSLVGKIARSFNVQIVENLLVGFKYINEVIWQLESTGRYEDVTGTEKDVIIGSEESHGMQTTTEVRDKDAGGAAVILAELALERKRKNSTVVSYLGELAKTYGYHRNEVLNIVMTGIEGKSNMTKMLDSLRKNPPKVIGGLPVTKVEDLRDENGRMGAIKGATDYASRNFLIFRLGEGGKAKVVLRPSGTEPKAKAYLEVSTDPYMAGQDWPTICRAADEQIQALASDFLAMALGTVGQQPAPGADKVGR